MLSLAFTALIIAIFRTDITVNGSLLLSKQLQCGLWFFRFIFSFGVLLALALSTEVTRVRVRPILNSRFQRWLGRAILLSLSSRLPLKEIVDSHDQVRKRNLLAAQRLFYASHCLDKILILFIIFVLLIWLILIGIKFDKLFLELLLRIWLMHPCTIDCNDFAELRSTLALARLINNPHDDILEKILSSDRR